MKHIDPSDINIINFLSGEMTTEEMSQFKLQLDENQLLREQVEEMRIAQSLLGVWDSKEIEVPSFTPRVAKSKNSTSSISKAKKIHFPTWVKYAAAFFGVVMLLQITGFRANHDGNTLLLSFGEPNSTNINANDVDAIVAKAMLQYVKNQENQMADFKSQVGTDLNSIATAVNGLKSKNDMNLAQLEGMFSRNMDKQYVSLESMIKGIEDNQRQELEDSFTGLVEYIENKRQNDQYKIQNAFSEIATAIDNQQYQTNALLTSISDEDAVLKSY